MQMQSKPAGYFFQISLRPYILEGNKIYQLVYGCRKACEEGFILTQRKDTRGKPKERQYQIKFISHDKRKKRELPVG